MRKDFEGLDTASWVFTYVVILGCSVDLGLFIAFICPIFDFWGTFIVVGVVSMVLLGIVAYRGFK